MAHSGDEVGLTQIMIAVDPTKANSVKLTDEIVDKIIVDMKSSVLEKEGLYYSGELETKNIQDNLKNGIPVVEEKWNEVLAM